MSSSLKDSQKPTGTAEEEYKDHDSNQKRDSLKKGARDSPEEEEKVAAEVVDRKAMEPDWNALQMLNDGGFAVRS